MTWPGIAYQLSIGGAPQVDSSLVTPALQINGIDPATGRGMLARWGGNPVMSGCRSAGAAVGTHTAVAAGTLFTIAGCGSDGTQFRVAAQMLFTTIAATPGPTDMQGQIIWQVSPAASVTPSQLLTIDWTNGLRFGTGVANILSAAGAVIAKTQVIPHAATSTLNATTDTGITRHTNTGAAAAITETLPAATVGLKVIFAVTIAQALQIKANGAETIRILGSVSTATTGQISNATIGGYIDLECLVAGQWFAVNVGGTWTVT